MAREYPYGVWFVSPRGFANEGVFAYGTQAEAEYYEGIMQADEDSRVSYVCGAQTLENAKKRAEKCRDGAGNATTQNYTEARAFKSLIEHREWEIGMSEQMLKEKADRDARFEARVNAEYEAYLLDQGFTLEEIEEEMRWSKSF